jgi:hypothetical protein
MRARRAFLTLLSGAAAWPLAVRAQQRRNAQTPKLYRIGFLFAGTIALRPQAQEFWRKLQELGYSEDKNFISEVRDLAGRLGIESTRQRRGPLHDLSAAHCSVVRLRAGQWSVTHRFIPCGLVSPLRSAPVRAPSAPHSPPDWSARRPPSPRAGAGAKSIRYSRSAVPVP